MQEELVAEVMAGRTGEHLLLLEHESIYTIGRTRDRSSLRDVERLRFPVVETNRGGQATYHGPGQLVGYPILRLSERGRDLHIYLRFLEEFLVNVCEKWGVRASRREGLTGVWVGEKKVASIGVGVRNWVTMHGFALNVGYDISPFDEIVPCGIAGVRMTSLSIEAGKEVAVEDVASFCLREFFPRLDSELGWKKKSD